MFLSNAYKFQSFLTILTHLLQLLFLFHTKPYASKHFKTLLVFIKILNYYGIYDTRFSAVWRYNQILMYVIGLIKLIKIECILFPRIWNISYQEVIQLNIKSQTCITSICYPRKTNDFSFILC